MSKNKMLRFTTALLLVSVLTATTATTSLTASSEAAASTESASVCPDIYVGDCDNDFQPLIDHPDQWDYVRQNCDGLYINFVGLGSLYSMKQLTSFANMMTHKNAYIESDMQSASLKNDQSYINRLQTAGFNIPYTSLNYGWSQERQDNLKTYALPSGSSPRLCLIQQGPWDIGGSITDDFDKSGGFTNEQYRGWINKADGDSTDGPLGYWYNNNAGMKSGSYSMVQYARSLGKKSAVMLCPYGAGVADYDTSKFLSVGVQCVQEHEDNDAEPDVWDVFKYATKLDVVPEQTNGAPANTVSGMAYYLVKHIKGDANTLDLYATSNSGTTKGKGVFNAEAGSADQQLTFGKSVAAGTVYHYSLKASDLSSWCDYAGVLKADVTGSDAWKLQFKLGKTDITSNVVNGGFKFYQDNRLTPNTTRTVDLYITRTKSTNSDDLSINLQLLSHFKSTVMDSFQIAAVAGGSTKDTTSSTANQTTNDTTPSDSTSNPGTGTDYPVMALGLAAAAGALLVLLKAKRK